MTTTIHITDVFIRYKGVFDFNAVWSLAIGWLESKGFEVKEDKAKRNMKDFGEEMETQLSAWRNVTDYYRFKMTFYQKYWDGEYVEVVQNGVKKRMLKARIVFKISGDLVTDYSDRYETSKLTKAVGKFLNNYIYKWQIDAVYGDQLFYKVHELHDLVKDFLKMEVKGSEFADMW